MIGTTHQFTVHRYASACILHYPYGSGTRDRCYFEDDLPQSLATRLAKTYRQCVILKIMLFALMLTVCRKAAINKSVHVVRRNPYDTRAKSVHVVRRNPYDTRAKSVHVVRRNPYDARAKSVHVVRRNSF
jgi:hypothetical protein